ncbi:dicarboxylate/amino acid:cation symporter [Aurantiacibacter gangjinensis]|uniref:Glutamate:proton symporter n=1 Tax=Aurantiacibacter gangjinensis TaxID=502682 RepID=A0A0G9MKL6_9SPHN|nr:dicarboxylate/amino acid:cation symporter [Aurantiacibacter gangjinensis]APE29474.1 Proton/glutamate symport protein, Sodium/glutamate symport protein [Aurantiacibacter gangjinensis]KLE31149.1 glutamate:proton symporter [Aurantiacibacter gangjinensis]
MKTWFAIPLWQRVVAALILGAITGYFWGPGAESIKIIGDIFIDFIKMLIVPLIFFSVVSGVASIGNLGKLGSVGWRAILLFVITGQVAVWLGLALGTWLEPGVGLDTSGITMGETPDPAPFDWREMLRSMIPVSPVSVMADVRVLPLIVFSLLVGIGILLARGDVEDDDEAESESGVRGAAMIARAFDGGALIFQKITIIVMELTPFGVFALMAWVVGTLGLDAVAALAKLVGLNYLGCLLIIGVMYTGILALMARVSVIGFFRGMVDAIAVAYSTASSSATLPVTLRCTQRNLGVSKPTSSFVVSLGSTINMDGTAMYLGLATLFGAQIFGVDLSMADYFMIALLATVGSIGAAGIPGGGLVMMGAIFTAVQVPLETIAFVAGVDRIMDMMRTATNVTGDATVTVTTASAMGELDKGELRSADDV